MRQHRAGWLKPNFKTAALNHSATLPRISNIYACLAKEKTNLANQFHRRRACYQVRREPANGVTARFEMPRVSTTESTKAAHAITEGAQRAQESRAIGDIISSLVDRRTRNSTLCASLTHSAPDFPQTLLAVPPETNGVLSHQQKEKLRRRLSHYSPSRSVHSLCPRKPKIRSRWNSTAWSSTRRRLRAIRPRPTRHRK